MTNAMTSNLTAAEAGALTDGLAETRDLALADGSAAALQVATSNNEQWLALCAEGSARWGADWMNARRL
jgi:hypothetical protein